MRLRTILISTGGVQLDADEWCAEPRGGLAPHVA
jgi:hypothetical protein